MKISIITVCFNSVSTIEDTINSIAQQSNVAIEHIIVDGGSSDGTREIIENSPSVSKYLFESDDGIYDAMNKGIKLATGEIIGILNSDDIYFKNNILQQVVDAFKNEEVDACYGDLVYVDQNNTDKVIRFWKSGEFKNGAFLKGWMPPHPTFFCRSSVYRQFGLFNLNYKLAADVELLFRFLEKFQIKAKYLPITLTKMRVGGATNRNLRNIKQQNEEVLTFLDIFYGRRVGRLNFLISKFIDRLNQYFSRNMN